MTVDVNDTKKIVTIWLTNAEKDDAELRAAAYETCAEYHAKKYMAAVFFSGKDDLFDNTLAMLRYNRRRCAEAEIQKQKPAATQ